MKPIRPNLDIYEGGFGKIPPQAPEMEEAVLGAILLEKNAIQVVCDILSPESFYKEAHGMIYGAAIHLRNCNEPIDILTVAQALRSQGNLEMVGGPLFISKLTNRVASTAHIESHARVIAQKFIAREMIRVCSETANSMYDDTVDVFDGLATHNNTIHQITQNNIKSDAKTLSEIGVDVSREVDQRATNPDFSSGILSRIKSVDQIIAGFANTDLIYIAARPSMGKTAFVVSTALKIAMDGIPVAFFSLEMSKTQLFYRMESQISGIEVEHLMKRALDQSRMVQHHKAVGKLQSLPIYIDDTPALSVYDFRAKVSRMKARYGIKAVFVDYVQLMTIGHAMSKKMAGNREQEVSTISRVLKQVAKECDVPVIALVQLSRAVETRGGSKKPILSDMRDSGSLEQDADIVGFLYRPEYYGFTEGENGQSTKGVGELIIAKNRNGRLGVAQMQFIEHLAMYTDFGHSYVLPNDYNPNKTIEPNTDFLPPHTSNEGEEKIVPF